MKRILFICIFLLLIPLTANAQKTLQDAAAATATGDTLSIGSSTSNGVLAQITGTFSGTVTWRATFNGTDYVDVQATNLTTGTTSTTATAAGLYSVLAPRIVAFRAPVTTYASGTITVTAAAANGVARMGSSGAPIDATFITQTPNSTLSAEQALSTLATGLLKNTTSTGVLSIAGASDLPSGIDAAKIADGSVSNAEFQRLDGVTSGIQTQIDGKQAALSLGTGVATALAVNVGSAGAVVVNGGAGGTPSSMTLTNATNLPLTTGVTGILPAANGGTGVANNAASTITISGNFGTTFTVTGATNVTLPTSGTLATTAGNVATATALQNARTLWGQSFDGTANVTGSLTSVGDITGGAANMTITSGTGNSRTMIFKTTTSGGTATTFLTGNADQTMTTAGQIKIGGTNAGITLASSAVLQITDGSSGYGSLYAGNTGIHVNDGSNFKAALNPTTPGLNLSSDSRINFTNTIASSGVADITIRRIGAANPALAANNSATPLPYTLTIGESSRGGTDSNVAGASGTIQSGTGTGTGTVATLIFQTPTIGSSGTTAQSYATRLTLDSTNATFTGNVVTPTVNATTSLKINGNALFLSTTPTISSGFGVTPSIAGIASVFKVTVGTGGDTSGVIAFNGTFANAPACMANDETSNVLVRAVSTTTGVTISGVMAGADVIKIICAGY